MLRKLENPYFAGTGLYHAAGARAGVVYRTGFLVEVFPWARYKKIADITARESFYYTYI